MQPPRNRRSVQAGSAAGYKDLETSRALVRQRLGRLTQSATLRLEVQVSLSYFGPRLNAHLSVCVCVGIGLRQAQYRGLPISLKCCLAAQYRQQLPPLKIFADLQAQRRLGGLIEKYRETFIAAGDSADQESCGRSAGGDFGGGGGALTSGTGTTAGGGGRRDDEKIGRSRVVDNVASGIAQSGLALGARSGVTTGTSCGLTAAGAGAEAGGESKGGNANGASTRRGVSASISGISNGSAEVEAETPTAANSRVSLTIGLRIRFGSFISHPAIARRPRAECATCRRLTPRSSPGPARRAGRRRGTECRGLWQTVRYECRSP